MSPLSIEEMFYQPAWVEQRLAELGRSLLYGVISVAIILLLAMGWRMGLVVAGLLPLVTFSGLAVYAMGGGVLHQMAVAGMVIALGMLVDNAIVMVESLQWHRDKGRGPAQAAVAAVKELAGPLAAATGTTLAAFLPLLMSSGDTADFTRAIPIMVIADPGRQLSLCRAGHTHPDDQYADTPRNGGGPEQLAPGIRLATGLGGFVSRRPWLIRRCHHRTDSSRWDSLGGLMQRDFFPEHRPQPADRRPEFSGRHRAPKPRALARRDHRRPDLAALDKGHRRSSFFAGFSGPRFYYNLI